MGSIFFPDNDRETSRSYQGLLKSKTKTGGNHAFSEITVLQYGEKRSIGIF